MAKKSILSKLLAIVAWITGVLVSLAVGFGMVSKTLQVPFVQPIVPIAGWIVVIGTILSVIMVLIER